MNTINRAIAGIRIFGEIAKLDNVPIRACTGIEFSSHAMALISLDTDEPVIGISVNFFEIYQPAIAYAILLHELGHIRNGDMALITSSKVKLLTDLKYEFAADTYAANRIGKETMMRAVRTAFAKQREMAKTLSFIGMLVAGWKIATEQAKRLRNLKNYNSSVCYNPPKIQWCEALKNHPEFVKLGL